jgi:DNA-binding transcriptional LysR family regulator
MQGAAVSQADWNDFKIVLALGRGGSVAAAARLLGIDNSTVSRRQAAVEAALGACLIVRGGREFTFTPEGKVALAAAEAMEASAALAATKIRATKAEIEGVVRISCVPSIVRALLPFPAWVTGMHEKLAVELDSAARIVDLAKGDADIAIRIVRPTEIDVVAKHGYEMGLALYAAKSYVAQRGLPKHPDELRDHKLVLFATAFLHMPWVRWLEQFAGANSVSMRVDSAEMAQSVVLSGGGIGVIACFYGDQLSELVRVLPESVIHTIGYIVYHESLRDSAKVQVVVEALGRFFEERRDALSGRVLGSLCAPHTRIASAARTS